MGHGKKSTSTKNKDQSTYPSYGTLDVLDPNQVQASDEEVSALEKIDEIANEVFITQPSQNLFDLRGKSLNLYDMLMLHAAQSDLLYAEQTAPSVKHWINNILASCPNIYSRSDYQDLAEFMASRNIKPPKLGILAFSNPGYSNICYANCAIQTLLSIPIFCSRIAYLGDPEVGDIRTRVKSELTIRPFYAALYKIVRKSIEEEATKKSRLRPCRVAEFIGDLLERWRSETGEQHDMSEFLNFILEGLNDECKWKPQDQISKDAVDAKGFVMVASKGKKVEVQHHGIKEESPIKELFGGVLCYTTYNKKNTVTTISYEPFFVLHGYFTVDQRKSDVQGVKMSEIINSILAVQPLEKDGRREACFSELPEVLIICVSRFYYDKNTQRAIKICTPIKISEKLEITSSYQKKSNSTNLVYTLQAVTSHHGKNSEEGHYTTVALRKDGWYLLDDDIQSKTNELPTDGYVFCYARENIAAHAPAETVQRGK